MVKKYAREPAVPTKACKASGSDLKTHYKNTYEVCHAIKGMYLNQAQKYLQDVVEHKRCVPFVKYNGGVGRTGQAKEFGKVLGRWPQKSVKVVLGLLQNLESNARVRGLDIEKLTISHAQVNQAQNGRRRTYRAHGRINPYKSSPCHVELFATEKDENVKKEENKEKKAHMTRKQIARRRLNVGE